MFANRNKLHFRRDNAASSAFDNLSAGLCTSGGFLETDRAGLCLYQAYSRAPSSGSHRPGALDPRTFYVAGRLSIRDEARAAIVNAAAGLGSPRGPLGS